MNRSEILKEQVEIQDNKFKRATTTDSLPEDKAFLNRMKRIRFRDMDESELKRVWQIALRGIETREKVEREIIHVGDEIRKRTKDNTLSCGYKVGVVLDEALNRLKGMR